MTKDYGVGRGRNNRIAKAARKAAYNQAISEGRVVCQAIVGSFTVYPTAAAAQAVVKLSLASGLRAHVVDPSLAQTL